MSTSAPTLRRRSVPSALLDDERAVTVYLPPGYAPDGARYPVLYMQDGQRLFDADAGPAAEESWRMDRTADALIAAGVVEPLIIVGVAHAGPRRIEEYTPTATRRLGGGGAAVYLRFLIEELMPVIDDAYATATGPSRTGIGGSSLGGLVSLYAGLHRPDRFGRLAVLSPSVWWDRRVILRDVRTRTPEPRPRIWLDMGTAEGRRALVDARLLDAGLRGAGWVADGDLMYSEHAGATHRESAWASRVGPMLAFLFPATIARF